MNIFRMLAKINRLWLLLLAAILLGIVTTYISSSYLKNREKNIAAELRQGLSGPTTEVLVSARDLPAGATVGGTLVKRDVPSDLIEDGTLTAKDFDRISGVKLVRPLRAGYPINTSYFIEKARTFSEAVEDGMRAITIEVDEINSMAQMVKPGNRVDLMLLVPDKSDPDGGVEVMMVLQNVKVLATGQSVAPKESADSAGRGPQSPSAKEQGYSNFTFEVTPQEAATIALAQNSGKIRAVLRNLGDKNVVSLKNVNTRTLLRIEEKMAERRKIMTQTRLQDAAAEQDVMAKVKSKLAVTEVMPTIEYIIGGMGASAGGMGGGTVSASPSPDAAKPPDANSPANSPDRGGRPGTAPNAADVNSLKPGSVLGLSLEQMQKQNR